MAPLRPQTAAFIRAGLTRETALALQQATLQDSSENLLGQFSAQGSDAAANTPHPSHQPTDEPLPLVWRDLFSCVTRAASSGYLASLACMPPLLPPAAPAAEGEGPTSGAAIGSGSLPGQTTLAHDTVFRDFLSPEALVRRHRLGTPEVRRLYQTMQAFSLGFHQILFQLSMHAASRGLLLESAWRGYAMLWDGALRTIFPAETVQLSRERQAAIMTGEHLVELLREADAAVAAAQVAQAAAERAAEASAIDALGVRADAAAALQRTADLEKEVRRLSLQRDAQAAELEGQRRLAASLGRQLEETARPASSGRDSASARRVHSDALLASASKQAAAALSARDAALKQLGEEAAQREAAEATAQKLEARLAAVERQLEDVQVAVAAANEDGSSGDTALTAQQVSVVALEAAQQEAQEWKAKALAAEGQAAEATAKAEALADSLWPLTTRIKDLEAALTARTPS